MVDYYKVFYKVIIGFNLTVLLIIFGINYIFDLSACKLCTYQQYIFISTTLLGLIALFIKFLYKPIGVIIFLLYLSNSGIALYQVLTEEGYISAPSACTGMIPTELLDLENYKARILSNEFVPCNMPAIRFFSISLAGYSLIASNTMFLFSLIFSCVFILFRYTNEEATR